MDYKVKLAAVRRFQNAVSTVVRRYYTDDVGHVRHTPRLYYRVLKRNLKEQRVRFKRIELLRFARIAFVLANCEQMERRHVELVFYQLLAHDFLVEMLFRGFKVSASAVKKVIALFLSVSSTLAKGQAFMFSRLFNPRLYLINDKFLI